MRDQDLHHSLPTAGFVRLPTVLRFIPVSASTWWHWVATGKAPKPVKLAPKVTAWRAADIHALIDALGGNSERGSA